MKAIPTLKSILVLFSLFFIISSCKKNCKPKDITYSVREITKSEVPYTGYDTLTFIRTSVGDTHVFIGQGKTMDYKYTSDAADCANKYTSENYYYTYISKTFDSDLLIGYQSINSLFEHYLIFKNQRFVGDLPFVNKPDLDSLRILNTTYYNIQFIPDIKPETSTFIAYFTKAMGCIKIKFPNDETWELLSLKQ